MTSISRSNLVSLLYYLLPVIAVFSWRNLIGAGYTGWDTHDIGFTNFLYFSDSIASGFVPLWNPFIHSGTFFPSINNIGLVSPFELPFAFIAHFLSPVLVYEWFIQFIILMGGIGSYIFFRSAKIEHDLACLGATLFIITSLIPNVGQLSFIFSLSILFWTLAAAHAILKNKISLAAWPLFGILCGFAMSSGYAWMNLMTFVIFVSYSVFLNFTNRANTKEVAYRFVLFLLPMLLTYSVLIFPGYSNLSFNYSNFLGDYIYPAPEIERGINSLTLQSHHYASLWTAIKVLINPDFFDLPYSGWRLEKTTGWSMGAGLITILLFVNATLKKPKIKPDFYFWIVFSAIGLLYAAGIQPMYYLGKHLPLFNANRWWFLGLDYSVIGLLILTLLWTQDAFGKAELTLPDGFGLIGVKYGMLLALIILLLNQNYPAGLFLIILSAISVLTFRELAGDRRRQIIFLALLAIAESLLLVRTWANDNTYGSSFLMNKGYVEQVKQRTISPVIVNQNGRINYSTNWYIDKTPSSGGYDNLGNPVYWFIKDTPVVSQLFSLTSNSRQEKAVHRADFSNDNAYVNAIVADILSEPKIPTVNTVFTAKPKFYESTSSRILHTELQPNKGIVSVETNESTLVIFNNNYAPGWETFVDGQRVQLIKINHLFMGAEVQGSGNHIVIFQYKPKLVVAALLLPYIALIIYLLMLLMSLKSTRSRTLFKPLC